MTIPIVPTVTSGNEPTGIDGILASLPAPFSIEVDERKTAATDFEEIGDDGMPIEAPTTQRGALGMPEDMDKQAERAMAALYTPEFPLLKQNQEPTDSDWSSWAEMLWKRHTSAVTARLHLVERNRLFRKGIQWVSSVGLGPWREPPKPRDAARIVHNMVAPALDQRVQLIAEQRPGFRTRPQSLDATRQKRAEAQQNALEYQYDQQGMSKVLKEMEYWAGTDGISFCELVWDTERGPWDDALGTGNKIPLGDIRPIVRRLEQVRVSANSTYTQEPWYWIVRETMDTAQAVREYGLLAVEDVSTQVDPETVKRQGFGIKQGFQLPEVNENQRDQEVLDRITIYCKKSEFLPQGMTLVILGQKVMMHGPLLFGRPPIFAMRDGSTDPAFFPAACMELWIDSQMRVNAVLSKWVENVRLNAGPKLLGKSNSIVGETLVGGTMSLIEVRGLGAVNDNVRPIEAFSLSADAKELLDREKKAFEDLTGWNDVSRGQFASDQSGRAILAIREQLERIFAPLINSAAEAMTDWAKISLAIMKWGYDQPRTLALQGEGRPDLAIEISKDDFDGVVDVWIDPETLMPMPRALRMAQLDQMFDRGIIDQREYRQRQQFSWTRNLTYSDEIHEARARRVCEAIRETGNAMALPILWQDNEAIQQDVLEKELILPDDLDPQIRSAAFERWMMLANQQAMKAQGMMGPGAAPPMNAPQQGGPPHQAGSGMPQTTLPPGQQPFQGTNPSVAASNAATMSGPDENRAARSFDQMPH